jgi:serine/threonine-protein kinase
VQSVASDPTLLARFQREGEITSGLDSPHLVEIYESGVAPDGAAFIAMELLAGRDLSWHLRRRGAFSIADALMLMDHLCAGLDAAHGAGIVHRDIKPRNLFLAEVGGEEVWKILDFGVSKLKTATGTLTHSGLVGTPGYMAPEQAEARRVDERADLFAAGAVLYRVLTGRPAFSGAGPAQILYEVVHRQPQRPSKLVPDLPKQVEYVLAIALAKNPRYRFGSGSNLFAAFREAAAGRLDERLVQRARRLLKAQPWGCIIHGEVQSLGPSSSMSAAIMMDS